MPKKSKRWIKTTSIARVGRTVELLTPSTAAEWAEFAAEAGAIHGRVQKRRDAENAKAQREADEQLIALNANSAECGIAWGRDGIPRRNGVPLIGPGSVSGRVGGWSMDRGGGWRR